MVLNCPTCGGSVGEESCVGCQYVITHYVCSRCHGIVMNPRYRSGVECPSCGGHIIVHPHKQSRQYVHAYVCQNCGTIVDNPKFTHDHSCEGCKPPTCNVDGRVYAVDIFNKVYVCPECGSKEPFPM